MSNLSDGSSPEADVRSLSPNFPLSADIEWTPVVALKPKAYAFRMSKKPRPSSRVYVGRMKLIALLMYVAAQKQKSQATMEKLFSRLMLPKKD